MRRLALAVLAVGLMATTALAEEEPNPAQALLEFFEAPENAEFVAQFTRDPVPGKGMVEDPMGDFGHSTGQTPGYTPDFIDITEAWASDFIPGPELDFFHPTDTPNFWQPGPGMHDSAQGGTFYSYTSPDPMDGSQFDSGSYFFGVEVVGNIPGEVPGRCEFVVWVNDLSIPNTFTNFPDFPNDPAGGTNRAFGIGLNPDPTQPSGPFSLLLSDTGGFAPHFDHDIRGYTNNNYAGIYVPRNLIGELGGVNFYTFCVEEGFSFAPEDTGSDQTGLIELTDDDLGVIEVTAVSATTSTSTSSTSSTSTTSTSVAETTSTTLAVAEGGGFPWPLVLIGGLGLAIVGFILFKSDDDPCRDELEAWQAAQAKCDEARKKAAEAQEACEEKKAEVEDLEEERREVCKEWPPACWDNEEGGWIEGPDGERITSRDIHMRRMALGQIWDDYKSDKLTAREVEAKWKEADTPEFREDMRERDAKAKAEMERIDQALPSAKADAKEACDKAETADAAAVKACEAADKARQAYEECIGAAVAGGAGDDAGTDSGGDEGGDPTGPTPPSSGGTAPPPPPKKDPCEGQPKHRTTQSGKAEKIEVTVDFSVRASVEGASERNTKAGDDLVFDLSRVAQTLDFAGDMLSAKSAAFGIGGGVAGFGPGKYVESTLGMAKGGVDAVSATTDLLPDIPTSAPQAVTEFLETVTKMTEKITAAVTNWMKNYQLFKITQTYFYQIITATPYKVYECRKGVGWVCVEQVWEFDVSNLKKRRGKVSPTWTVNSDVRRHAFQREMKSLNQISVNRVKNDAKKLMKWKQQRRPGPC